MNEIIIFIFYIIAMIKIEDNIDFFDRILLSYIDIDK